jgi:AcrR family transcriptional regulator
MAVTLTEARSALVRERILQGLERVLSRDGQWTFASVAKAADVPERTLYRYFPTREALLEGLFDWANARVGFQGQLPEDSAALQALVRRCFPGFDALAPVVRELLLAPEGRQARLKHKTRRQRASLRLVRCEAPHLGANDARCLAAIVQLLSQAATWHALREYWDMDGAEAGEAAVLAIDLLLESARARRTKSKTKIKSKPNPVLGRSRSNAVGDRR